MPSKVSLYPPTRTFPCSFSSSTTGIPSSFFNHGSRPATCGRQSPARSWASHKGLPTISSSSRLVTSFCRGELHMAHEKKKRKKERKRKSYQTFELIPFRNKIVGHVEHSEFLTLFNPRQLVNEIIREPQFLECLTHFVEPLQFFNLISSKGKNPQVICPVEERSDIILKQNKDSYPFPSDQRSCRCNWTIRKDADNF